VTLMGDGQGRPTDPSPINGYSLPFKALQGEG
jgi:hypothetical protein